MKIYPTQIKIKMSFVTRIKKESKYQHYSMGHGADFPSERYISEKTGKPINIIYFGSLIMLPEIVSYVIKCGFTKIHEKRSHYDVNSYTTNEVYEYKYGLHFHNVLNFVIKVILILNNDTYTHQYLLIYIREAFSY